MSLLSPSIHHITIQSRNTNVIYMNIFIIMLNCLQSDPFKLETGGMVDMKELKKKYKKNSVYLDIP